MEKAYEGEGDEEWCESDYLDEIGKLGVGCGNCWVGEDGRGTPPKFWDGEKNTATTNVEVGVWVKNNS